MEDHQILTQETAPILLAKVHDISQRYRKHGASLRLVEEISNDASLLGDMETRKWCFERAIDLAPVSVAFFENFLSDEEFLSSYASEGSRLFGFYYAGACLTLNPRLWTSLVELALLPQIDFSDESLQSSSPTDLIFDGPPLLFPTPDLFLGCTDFVTSIALFVSLTQPPNADVATVSTLRALSDGFDLSPMTYLVVSGLNICAHHVTGTTDANSLWAVLRSHVQKSLNDLIDKYQDDARKPPTSAKQSADIAVNKENAPIEETDQPHNEGDDEAPSEANTCDGERDNLIFSIICESWRLRLLFYRQLNSPAYNLPEVIDEYKLFEMQLPEIFRVLKMDVDLALNDPKAFKDNLIRRAKQNPESQIDETNRAACLDFADRLYARSLEQWESVREFENSASRYVCDSIDEEEEEPPPGVEQRRDSNCWEGVSAARKEQLCLLWTKHLDKMEAQVVHMQDELETSLAQPRPRSANKKAVDFITFLSDVFFDARHQLSLHKRRITLSYVRAIEHLGDMRLDLFAAFWDFLQRSSSDYNILPGARWLTFWLSWCADTSCRTQPLKSCCWIRNLHHTRKLVASEMEDLSSFVLEMCRERRGPLSKFLLCPNWWKLDEVLPPPIMLEDSADELAVASPETIAQHTSDFLAVVYEALKIVEDVFRLYFSQDKVFTAGSSSDKDEGTHSENELNDQLLTSVSSILAMTETRVFDFTGYITSATMDNPAALDSTRDLLTAFFTSLLHMKAIKGVFLAKLHRPLKNLLEHLESVSELERIFGPLIGSGRTMQNLIVNVRLCQMLLFVVCTNARYFKEALRGTWMVSCVLRGEYCPRSMAHVFFEAPIVSSFESILERLITDENLEDARARPELAAALIAFGEFAHQESLRDIDMSNEDPFSCEAQDAAMHSQADDSDTTRDGDTGGINSNGAMTTPSGDGDIEMAQEDRAPEITSGRMSGLLNWLADLAPAIREKRSWATPPQQIDLFQFTRLTPNCPPATFPKLGAPVRVALEELKEKPFVTHQTSLARETTPQASFDFVSLSSSSSSSDVSLSHAAARLLQPSSGETWVPSKRMPSPLPSRPSPTVSCPSPTRRLSVEDLEKLTRATRDGHESSLPALAPPIPPALPHNDDLLPVEAFSSAKKGETVVQPQVGKHYLQTTKSTSEFRDLLGTPIQWSTLYVSELPHNVTRVSLEHDFQAIGCEGLKEIRLIEKPKGQSKLFAYVDFETPELAQEAVKKLNGYKLQGDFIKAAISAPKKAIYEERVLFVSNLPGDSVESEISDLFRKAQASRPENRKRGLGSEANAKRAKRKIEGDSSSEGKMEEVVDAEQDEISWTVKSVRLIRKAQHSHYGYVEFDDPRAVPQILDLLHRKLLPPLTLREHEILVAPSIPKKSQNKKIVQKARPKVDDVLKCTLHATGFPLGWTEEKLLKVFEAFGKIVKYKVPKTENKIRGFALVQFDDPLDAAMALSSLHNSQQGSRTIKVLQSNRVITESKRGGVEAEAVSSSSSNVKNRLQISGSGKKRKSEKGKVECVLLTNEDFRQKFLS